MRLEKDQKNEIVEAIAEGGLNPIDCDLSDGPEVRIRHASSGAYFTCRRVTGNYTVHSAIGSSPFQTSHKYGGWSRVLMAIQDWAADVRRDVDTPDLWAELQRDREMLTGARYEAVENKLFSPDEQAEVAKQLREIKEYVKETYSLSSEQMSLVEARFDEIQAATRRLGRKDWLLLFWGVMFTVIVSGLLPQEAVRHILVMAYHGLDHLFGSGGGPPQLPPMP